MRKFPLIVLLLIMFFLCSKSWGWDGYDYNSGSYIEIDKGNLVRPGEDVEYYDYGSGEYKYGNVESINSYGSSVELEVYDYDSGDFRTFDME